jgi:hypothetical protein
MNDKLKEKYIKARNENKLEIDFLYEYYIKKCNENPVDFNTFMSIIQFADINGIFENLDLEFDVTCIFDSNGKFIMCLK